MFNIRVRLVKLGKKQVDLIPELIKLGIKTEPAELSKILSGYYPSPKADRTLSACNAIVAEWEKERSDASEARL